MNRLAVVVLAAGSSRRMGDFKLLKKIGDSTVLEMTLRAASSLDAYPKVVVLGHRFNEVDSQIHSKEWIKVFNPDYMNGISTSLKAGFRALPAETDAVMVALADQPLVEVSTLHTLVERHFEANALATIPVYKSRRGNPVILSYALKTRILTLEGDVGARKILEQESDKVQLVKVEDPGVVMDLDTPEDFSRALQLLESRKQLKWSGDSCRSPGDQSP
ncbi:MAG: nucleotidyltransferase family protein [Thermoprotei archaeon]